MKKILLLLTLGVGTIHVFAQTPCVNGFAGQYPCNGYDLMAHMSAAELTGDPTASGNDSWGWTDPDTGKEYAIIGLSTATAFVDISDPVNPVYLGRVETETFDSSWRAIRVQNNHVFIVADAAGDHGMQVFDLKRLRNVTTPQVFTRDALFSDVGSCHTITIDETKPYAYLMGCENYNGGPVFVDISNPLNPTEAGGYGDSGYTHDGQIVTYHGPDTTYTGRDILVACNGSFGSNNKVVFLDVTDKSNPVLISELTYDNPGYTHQSWLTEDHQYSLLGDELDEMDFGFNSKTLVMDVRDLDNPTILSEYFGPTEAIDHNGFVKGNKFYLANYTAGIRVLDVTNVASPTNALTEIGFFDTYPQNNVAEFDGVWSVYPFFESENIVISDISGGFFLVRKSETMGTNELTANSIQIIPNPANDFVQIKTNNQQKLESVKLINTVGKEVFSKNKINQTNFQIDVSNLPTGVYIVKINNSISKKLLVK